MAEFLKILSVFLTSMVLYGKIAVPAAVLLFKYDLLKVFVVTVSGGILGNIFFVNMMAAILKWIHRYRVRKGSIHRKKIFTRFNKNIIRVKQRFGLTGLAFITPMFLSTPLGAFLAEKFYKNKRKIILYFSVSIVFWCFALYMLLLMFHDSLKGWLI